MATRKASIAMLPPSARRIALRNSAQTIMASAATIQVSGCSSAPANFAAMKKIVSITTQACAVASFP